MNTKEFILKAISIHGNLYDYSKSVYTNSTTKIEIKCNVCGFEFNQTCGNHTRLKQPCGCPICSTKKQGDKKILGAKNDFIYKAQLAHGIGRYDYTNSNYTHNKTEVEIKCNVCSNTFLQKPVYHIRTKQPCGCPTCGNAKNKEVIVFPKPELKPKVIKPLPKTRKEKLNTFVSRSTKKHGKDRYDYTMVDYVDSKTKIKIKCNKCDSEFIQLPTNHTHVSSNNGCPICYKPGSLLEENITKILDKHGIIYETRKTGLLENKRLELDIYLSDYNFAIECHGNYWHSEHVLEHTRAMKHMKDKLDQCNDIGITLIQLYEDEIVYKTELVERMILSRLNLLKTEYARKLSKTYFTKSELSKDDIKYIEDFFNTNHIQGISQYNSGCILGDKETGEFKSIMLFNNIVSNRGIKASNTSSELVRFCSSVNVVGGASRLLNLYLENRPDVKEIVSYSDNRISMGNLYTVLNFSKVSDISPSYYYVQVNKKSLERFHKTAFKRDNQRKRFSNFKEELTEYDNAANNGYKRLWNAGMKKWVLLV